MDRIEHAVRTDWIPVALDGIYVDAIHGALGEPAMIELYRRFTRESLVKSPTMRSLIDGVVRLFGVSVGTLLRALPGAVRQSYRDAFTIKVERGDQEAVVLLDDIAPEVLCFVGYPIVWHAVFLGLYDVAHTPPQLDYTVRRGARQVVARCRW